MIDISLMMIVNRFPNVEINNISPFFDLKKILKTNQLHLTFKMKLFRFQLFIVTILYMYSGSNFFLTHYCHSKYLETMTNQNVSLNLCIIGHLPVLMLVRNKTTTKQTIDFFFSSSSKEVSKNIFTLKYLSVCVCL